MMLYGKRNNGTFNVDTGAVAFKNALQAGEFAYASLTGIDDIGIVVDTVRQHASDLGIDRLRITLDRRAQALVCSAWVEAPSGTR